MEIAAIEGVELAYRTAGRESDAPIVLLHGYTGNLRNWALTVPALTSAGWRTLSPDNPGHGGSSAPEQFEAYALDHVATLVHQLAEGLDFTPAVIVGHSMGGAIAEAYAVQYPASVRALVLVDSAGGASGAERDDLATDLQALREAHAQGGMAAVFDYQLRRGKWPQLEALDADALALRRSEFARTAFQGFEFAALALRTRQETLSRLASLRVPTLIVRGEHESSALVQVAEDLAATIPSSRIQTIVGAGHNPQLEMPRAFNEQLLNFLDGLS